MDVDGVLADFMGHVISSLKLELQKFGLKRHHITSWNMIEDILRPDERVIAHDLLSHADWWAQLPVVPNAQLGFESLAKGFDRVVFLTVPWDACFGWESARKEWLKKHFGVSSSDVMTGEAKELVSGQMFVDDKPTNIQAWQKMHPSGEAWMYDMPYNKDIEWPLRCVWHAKGLKGLSSSRWADGGSGW